MTDRERLLLEENNRMLKMILGILSRDMGRNDNVGQDFLINLAANLLSENISRDG